MRILYATDGVFQAGGQLVNLEHVLALRRFGLDARFMMRPPFEAGRAPQFPSGVEAPWEPEVPELSGEDVVVLAEVDGEAAQALLGSPARMIVHNQNPFYSFEAFRDLDSYRGLGVEGMIVPSDWTGRLLRSLGWERPTWTAHPFLDPVFEPPSTPKAPAVAFMPRKRRLDGRLIRGALFSRHPQFQGMRWLQVAGVDRGQVADALQSCEMFLSLGSREGLGLPPLEAMACGCLVVGYHGGGGQEYATPENGDWFDDSAGPVEIADLLAERLTAIRAGERFEARRAAGYATAAAFSKPRFDAELKAAWRAILG